MADTKAEPGSAMCTLCGFAARMDANVDSADGVSSAFAFAVHFALEHPGRRSVSQYVVLVPEPDVTEEADRG